MEDFLDTLHLWRLAIIYLALFGVYLILLGVAVAGLIMALKKREDQGWR